MDSRKFQLLEFRHQSFKKIRFKLQKQDKLQKIKIKKVKMIFNKFQTLVL